MANVIKIKFEYRDYFNDKIYKFEITHSRHYGTCFHKTKEAYKDFLHYCNTNERLYNLGKDVNRFEKITLYRATGTIAYVYEKGKGILDYQKWLDNQNKKHKKKIDMNFLK